MNITYGLRKQAKSFIRIIPVRGGMGAGPDYDQIGPDAAARKMNYFFLGIQDRPKSSGP